VLEQPGAELRNNQALTSDARGLLEGESLTPYKEQRQEIEKAGFLTQTWPAWRLLPTVVERKWESFPPDVLSVDIRKSLFLNEASGPWRP
jgi:hypothetical protein